MKSTLNRGVVLFENRILVKKRAAPKLLLLTTFICLSLPVVSQIIYDFESATSVQSDGRGAGFGLPFGISSTFDTADDWTWCTASSATNTITIPFGAGTATVGEQGIRIGVGLELETNTFFFGWGPINLANTLRSPTYTVITGGNMTVTLSTPTSLLLYFSQDGGTTWTAATSGVAFAVAVGTVDIIIVGNDGVDSNISLDMTTITHTAVILPIELKHFTVKPTNSNQVEIFWQTVSELNNNYFTLERSKNRSNWEELIRVDGAGNSSNLLNYGAIDKNPYDDVSYYRLKQTDFNGQFKYSQVKSVNFSRFSGNELEVYLTHY